jgi:hypothetical protein
LKLTIRIGIPQKNETVFKAKSGKRQIGCSLMHNRLGHRSVGAIMLANKDDLWNDVSVMPEPDKICETCRITLSRKANRSKIPPLRSKFARHTILLDIEKNPSPKGLTPGTHFPFFLVVVDQATTFSVLLGTRKIPSAEVLQLVKLYWAMFRSQHSNDGPISVDFGNLRRIHSDCVPS